MPCTCGVGACTADCCRSNIEPIKDLQKFGIDDLALDTIRIQLMKNNWSAKRALEVSLKYKDFLKQFIGKPPEQIQNTFPPDQEVDDFWHQHILNTHKYKRDCELLFGFFLHHNPETDSVV